MGEGLTNYGPLKELLRITKNYPRVNKAYAIIEQLSCN
jgi:hypothetical protein